jgi:hypothetical protein
MATAMITNFFKKATPADIEEQKKKDAVYRTAALISHHPVQNI